MTPTTRRRRSTTSSWSTALRASTLRRSRLPSKVSAGLSSTRIRRRSRPIRWWSRPATRSSSGRDISDLAPLASGSRRPGRRAPTGRTPASSTWNKGVVGVAPQATAHVMSYFDPAAPLGTSRSYALIARRILASTASLRFGDLLQIEIHIDGQIDGRTRVVPVETEPAIFEAVRLVTRVGIIVVEAGGNGDSNLDNFRDRKGRRVL